MTKNKLTNLTDHLFMQLERLTDEDIDADKLELEAKRAESIVAISDQIISTADLQLKAAKLFADHGENVLPLLPQIGNAKTSGGSE
ncbi:hypothetical protein [Mangrovicoccus ximenensis]|uniref:hypothetical protein n=1 Tax=Mangrovicoccus ximenensis TaxID=1911570 RepID=UPI000D3D7F4C|nr:hypothetical protein [Mangrovicoccus ximenensis]